MTNDKMNAADPFGHTDKTVRDANAETRPRTVSKAKGAIGGAMSYPPQVVLPPDGAQSDEPQAILTRAGPSWNGAVPECTEAANRSRDAAKAKQPQQVNKTQIVLKALRRKRGASLAELQELTGWQPHSVRGLLSASVRKKLGLTLTSEVGKDDIRRYRIDDAVSDA